MTDAIVGRTLVLIIGIAFSIWFVRSLSWENKVERFFLRFAVVGLIVRMIGDIVFNWIGLFPID